MTEQPQKCPWLTEVQYWHLVGRAHRSMRDSSPPTWPMVVSLIRFTPSFLRLGSWNVAMFVTYEQMKRALMKVQMLRDSPFWLRQGYLVFRTKPVKVGIKQWVHATGTQTHTCLFTELFTWCWLKRQKNRKDCGLQCFVLRTPLFCTDKVENKLY